MSKSPRSRSAAPALDAAPAEAPTAVVARRLRLHSRLGPQSEDALKDLLGRAVDHAPGALIAEAGDAADLVTVIQAGFACRMSLLPDGRRQIHSLFLPGETADAETPLLARRLDSIEALTRCLAWSVPKSRFAGLLQTCPELAEAFAREAAVAAQVAREWVVNVGRRTGPERIAHLICELFSRLDAMGLAEADGFELPLTQAEIADAQGLSPVHVNRVLQELRGAGLIRSEGRRLVILDWPGLQALAAFDPQYLQLRNLAA